MGLWSYNMKTYVDQTCPCFRPFLPTNFLKAQVCEDVCYSFTSEGMNGCADNSCDNNRSAVQLIMINSSIPICTINCTIPTQ